MLQLSYAPNFGSMPMGGGFPAGPQVMAPCGFGGFNPYQGGMGGMAQMGAMMQMMMTMQMLMTFMAASSQMNGNGFPMLQGSPNFGGGFGGCGCGSGNSLGGFLGSPHGYGPSSGGGYAPSFGGNGGGYGPSPNGNYGSSSGGSYGSGQANGNGSSGGAQGMSPPSSTGTISSLSENRDERLRQVVDAAKRTYPDQPHMARLAAAQALLESGIASQRGPSGLARNHNNLFGIKGRGTAGTANMRTGEHIGGRNVTINAGFARNNTVEDSFTQHRNLMNRPRYRSVLQSQSFEQAARAVQSSGYATAPNYASSLISTYNTHLARFF